MCSQIYWHIFDILLLLNCENNKSISENGLFEIINEKLNSTNITRLKLENKVKYIYIDKDKILNEKI